MQVKKEFVIIRISEEDRQDLFSKKITRLDGTVMRLFTGVQAEKGSDESFSQSVSVGTVVAVGAGVEGILEGDLVIMDYIVDTDDALIVEQTREHKLVCIRAVTTVKRDTHIVDANRRTPHPTVVHRAGEIDEFSMVIGVVREGAVFPVKPYLFCQHVAHDSEWKKRASGLYTVDEQESDVVEREVVAAYAGADASVGDIVVAHTDGVFDRKLNAQQFDIIPAHEVMAIVKIKKEQA